MRHSIILIAVLTFSLLLGSCQKEELTTSYQSENGLPEVNLHSLTITDSIICGTISNISQDYDYIKELHGSVYLVIAGEDSTFINGLDNDALNIIRKGYDYKFLIDNPTKSNNTIVKGSFEEKYSTRL